MFTKSILVSIFAALCAAPSVSAHGALVRVTGANGVIGQGFAIDPTTPRNGTTRVPFQRDISIIRDREMEAGRVGPCGRTLQRGVTNIYNEMLAATAAGLPEASSGGIVNMTIHQVNRDGAGPYSCQVSADGTGERFVTMKIITNVPGVNGLSTKTKKSDLPLVAQMPVGIKCTGGPNGNACLVRCRNPVGPFGGCAAVATAGGGKAASAGGKCTRSDISLEESDDALAEDVYKRAIEIAKSFEGRALRSRTVGAARAG
ncbi:hypothetical protein FRC10_011361 [Ceratobasidium sp. 414]|nr:hypothetical protein FRC10_011361 [Ceratobasidium sp. 414]